MTTRTVMVMASMVVTTLIVALGAPTPVFARGRWQDVLTPRGGGRPATPSFGIEPKASPERVRAPAPAPAPDRDDAPPARTRSSRVLAHEAGDRLREALAAAQDDPRSAAKIQRLIAQAAAEARRNKALGERVWYWRDPFSEHPRQPIVLSLEVQLEMQLWQARQEAARAHEASISARVEAAAAHAEAARARVEAARAEGTSGKARQDSRSMRGIDEQALLAPPAQRSTVAVTREGDADGPAVRKRPARRATVAKTALARNEATGSPGNRHRDIGAVAAAPVAPATDSEDPPTDPATWRSSDPRGIVVVPINATAPATTAPARPTLAGRR